MELMRRMHWILTYIVNTFRRVSNVMHEHPSIATRFARVRIDPWLRNTSIYRRSQFDLSGIEFLRASTLNTTFDTHWSDSNKPFKLYIESMLNFSTDLFQELFAVELTLPDVNFMASLEIEAVPGWNVSDSTTWYFGSIDSSGLPMTQFAELACEGGTWSTANSYAEFQQSWMMINNTLLQRGLGEFVSRNQNITIRGQGARKSTSLLDRMLNYIRFDYTFPAKGESVRGAKDEGGARGAKRRSAANTPATRYARR